MKKFLALLLVVVACFGFAGCEDTSVKQKEANYTETIKTQSLNTVGLPNVTNFFEMAELKEIYEMRDNPKLVCYWYTVNQYTGKLIYKGKCIGYGIPYGTQITNPETYYTSGVALPQAEPNGLYSSGSTSATWILSVNKDGKIEPSYVEQAVEVYQSKRPANECEAWSLPSDY